MAAIFGLGGPLSRADCPRRDRPLQCVPHPQLQLCSNQARGEVAMDQRAKCVCSPQSMADIQFSLNISVVNDQTAQNSWSKF